jgi:hypothetical protein
MASTRTDDSMEKTSWMANNSRAYSWNLCHSGDTSPSDMLVQKSTNKHTIHSHSGDNSPSDMLVQKSTSTHTMMIIMMKPSNSRDYHTFINSHLDKYTIEDEASVAQ